MSKRKESDGPERGSGQDASGGEELALEGLEEEAPEMEPLLDDADDADVNEADSAGPGPEADGESGEVGKQAELLPDGSEASGSGREADPVEEPLPEFRLVRHTFEWAEPELEVAAEPEPEWEPEPEADAETQPESGAERGAEADADPGPGSGSEVAVEVEDDPSDAAPLDSVPDRGDGQLALGDPRPPESPAPPADGEPALDDDVDPSVGDPVLVRLALARELWAEGEQQAALNHLDAALAAAPERPEVLTELGSTMGILGRYEEADRYLRRAQRLVPGDLSVAAQLAIILFRRGLYAAAELELRAITERDPGQADALFYRGEALNRLGRADEALDVLTRVVELEPTNPRAYQLLGMLYDRKAMPELATAMYRKARELGRR